MTEIIEAAPAPIISRLFDSRVNCWSIMTETTVGRYLDLSDISYGQRGGLSHQRDALKTSTGRRIRARMVEDVTRGAVLPPIVVGIVADATLLANLEQTKWQSVLEIVESAHREQLAIIDGMQRTTALREALAGEQAVADLPMRLEIWLAENTDSLIYRMLILNTGQVPWNLKQQLKVVYEPLVAELSKQIEFGRFLVGKERRWKGGEFSADSLIEAYIAFGLRRTEVDTQESLADEFSRLDMADALTSKKYDRFFYPVVQMMVNLDLTFSKYDPPIVNNEIDDIDKPRSRREFGRGRNIFDTQPARVGFIVATAIYALGRISMDKEEEESVAKLVEMQRGAENLIMKLDAKNSEEMAAFLALDVLAERLSKRPTSAVGRWERTFFETAFKVLVDEHFEVPSLEPCWRA